MGILDIYRESIKKMAETTWLDLQNGLSSTIKRTLEKYGYQVEVRRGKFPTTIAGIDFLLDKDRYNYQYIPIGKTVEFADNIVKPLEARYQKEWQRRIAEEMKVYTVALSSAPMKKALDTELGKDRIFTDLEYLQSINLTKYAKPLLKAYGKVIEPDPLPLPKNEIESYLTEAEQVYNQTIMKSMEQRVDEALRKLDKLLR